jgi:hypothetical protein
MDLAELVSAVEGLLRCIGPVLEAAGFFSAILTLIAGALGL